MNVTNCMHAYILQQEDDCNRKIQTSELAHPDQRFQYRLGGRVIVGDNPRVVNTDLCVCVCVRTCIHKVARTSSCKNVVYVARLWEVLRCNFLLLRN